jgi:hypothetical protein
VASPHLSNSDAMCQASIGPTLPHQLPPMACDADAIIAMKKCSK